jgi:hypothetical protein
MYTRKVATRPSVTQCEQKPLPILIAIYTQVPAGLGCGWAGLDYLMKRESKALATPKDNPTVLTSNYSGTGYQALCQYGQIIGT